MMRILAFVPMLILAGLLALIVFLARRRKRLINAHLPADAPRGSWWSAVAETSVLALVGVGVLAFVGTSEQLNGMLLSLGEQPRSVVIYSLMAAAVAAVGCIIALAVSWFRGGSTAAVVMFLALSAYGILLNGTGQIGDLRHEAATKRGDIAFTLDVSGPNVTGIDFWANDVYLGKTPVRMMLSEFLAKVPDWEIAPGRVRPAGPLDEQTLSRLRWAEDKHWARFSLPTELKTSDELRRAIAERKGRDIYIRTEYQGEAGLSGGGSGGGGVEANYSIGIAFRFPQREAAIERLMDQARLAEYEVDEAWLQATADFGPDGWIAIRKAAVQEAGMGDVFDKWVNWKYHVDEVRNRSAAWDAFVRIRTEADDVGYYLTASPAGRATEILVPQLDADRLVNVAMPLVTTTTSVYYSNWRNLFGETHLGVSKNGHRLPQMPESGTGSMSAWGNEQRLSPSDMALAHAIWLVDRISPDDEAPNPIERRLSTQILRSHLRVSMGLQVAALLGGPEVEKFVNRKYDATRGVDVTFRFEDREQLGGISDVNRWLYWGADLRGQAGQRFRKQNQDEIFAMADRADEHGFFSMDEVSRQCGFLFLENEHGPDSFGMKYWPRFTSRQKGKHNSIQGRLGYLLALEPASTIDMYKSVWEEEWTERKDYTEIDEMQRALRRLPAGKRAIVLDGMLAFFNSVAEQTPDPNGMVRSYVLPQLRRARFDEIDDAASVAYQLETLRGPAPRRRNLQQERARFAENLANTAPERPLLVATIAGADEAELRLLAVPALRAHPTPANRALLAKLLEDSDERVRLAAQAANEELAELRASMPK